MTRSSLYTHQRKQVLDFKISLHQNEAEATTEAKAHCRATIREVEACHATHIREAEAHCATHVREAEANCASIMMEIEAHCAVDIRKAESHCVEHACSIQQLHAVGMQHLEKDVMEEEVTGCLSFLAAFGVAFQAWPKKPMGY